MSLIPDLFSERCAAVAKQLGSLDLRIKCVVQQQVFFGQTRGWQLILTYASGQGSDQLLQPERMKLYTAKAVKTVSNEQLPCKVVQDWP